MDINKELSYEIQYTKTAEKFFRSHEAVRTEYCDAIRELIVGEHPEKVDIKRIQGKDNVYYRIRLGRWRVIYTVIDGNILVIKTVLAGSEGTYIKKIDGLK